MRCYHWRSTPRRPHAARAAAALVFALACAAGLARRALAHAHLHACAHLAPAGTSACSLVPPANETHAHTHTHANPEEVCPPELDLTCARVSLPQEDGHFCHSGFVDYPARVGAGQAVPGAREDAYAACAMRQLQLALAAFPCADRKTFTCEDCEGAYKAWLCAEMFPRCTAAATAGAAPAPGGIWRGDEHLVRPCRGTCHAVTQRCPAQLGFRCPGEEADGAGWADARAYSDDAATCTCVPPGSDACLGALELGRREVARAKAEAAAYAASQAELATT